jgi:GNAT superfamily N-acetyltransferase
MVRQPLPPLESADVVVRSAVGRFEDFAEVVGVKKPGGRGCWCMAYRDSRVANEDRPAFMRDACATEPGPGVIAYIDDDVPVGWCSVAPRADYRRLMSSRTIPLIDERDAWSVVCFVVRGGHQGHGIMRHLLLGAVSHAAAHGAQVVEGYPVAVPPGERVDVISGYVGTTRLFESAGFAVVAETTGHSGGRDRWVVRREL